MKYFWAFFQPPLIWMLALTIIIFLGLSACSIGPDYRKPDVQIPLSFKEGTQWQRAQANPQDTIASDWWQMYHDETLSQLVEQALTTNQSIIAAEAAYRVAKELVNSNKAALLPIISADMAATRSGSGNGAASINHSNNSAKSSSGGGVYNVFNADALVSWEPDLWGQIRREIESSKESAQATDAQLAGQRLSIAASVVSGYFLLRQADVDISLIKQQQGIYQHILQITQAALKQGTASANDVLAAQDTLDMVVYSLTSLQIAREQYEHALAVLIGKPPANFSLPAQPNYVFNAPSIPALLPSQLLERRPDVVMAERQAAAANAKIGVAQAAFFPTLDISVQGGFEHNTLAHLFALPNRIWTLGPELAATLFDGGARSAAVHAAQATYDQSVALYRNAVLTAFQNVEDSLSSWRYNNQQVEILTAVRQRNQQLFDTEKVALQAGTASIQSLITQQLLLLQAQQNLNDAQAELTQSSVTLIKNLGGGWQAQAAS